MRVLNKKKSWGIVPDKVDYKKRSESDFFLLLALFALIGCIVSLASCSTAYKVRKSYEKAAAYYPLTAEDSLNAIKIAKKVIPKETPPKIIPGKTVKIPYPVIKKVTDTAALKALADSFNNAMLKDANDIAQSCLDDVVRERKKAYEKGLNEGYQKVLNKLKTDSFDVKLPDTVLIPDPETYLKLTENEIKLRQSESSRIALNAKLSTYKWLFWVLLGGIIVGGIFGIKKIITSRLPMSKNG